MTVGGDGALPKCRALSRCLAKGVRDF